MHNYLKDSLQLIHYRNTHWVINHFVDKDIGKVPDIVAFSHTPLGVLENHTHRINSAIVPRVLVLNAVTKLTNR